MVSAGAPRRAPDTCPAVGMFKRSPAHSTCMVTIRPPTERVCERCGRHDEWDDDVESWVIATEDGEKQVGDPQCLHEWDINGTYRPVAEEP